MDLALSTVTFCGLRANNTQVNTLTLPHPRMGERDYVLVPMEDLMHDPVRFFSHGGVEIAPPDQRVGHVTEDLGAITWE